MSKRWYVVHAYSGFEKSVQRALTERVARSGMQDLFGQILVPVEEVVEMKNGQKSITERKFFPGYVLVEMEMNDDTWHLIKSTPKVTGFVGGTANKPTPISEKEVDKIKYIAQRNPAAPFMKEVAIIGDKRIPYDVLSSVLYTAGQNELENFRFVLVQKDPE